MIIYRFLRNSQTCSFSGVARHRERILPVSVARRIELCAKFNYTCQWEEVGSSRTGEAMMELDSPRKKEPVGKLAEVGGESFFSSVYYLLVGRKSGKKITKKCEKNFFSVKFEKNENECACPIDIAQTRQRSVMLFG